MGVRHESCVKELIIWLSTTLPYMSAGNFFYNFYFSLACINLIMLHYPGKEEMT
jgi:hypothetical protein